MSTLTYTKGLPTPAEELNALGKTQLEMFLASYAPVFHRATVETVNYLLSSLAFDKSKWNTHLQQTFGINKRHANGVITFGKGKVDGASEHRKLHIKTLEGKAKSCSQWLKKAEKKLKDARKFYRKKNWQKSKTGCNFPLASSLAHKSTNWQNLRFGIHQKKRKLHKYQQLLGRLKAAPLRVSVPRGQAFIVGSLDESFGNQACQWNGETITIRVPSCLESTNG